jgi:excisionase family DNA binding protein
MPDSETLWVASEVALYLRVALSTVYAWVEARKIPHLKVNGVIRFPQKELEEWLQKHSKHRSLPASPSFRKVTTVRSSSALALREAGHRAIHQSLASLSPPADRSIMADGKTAHRKGG